MGWMRLARLAICACVVGAWACGDDAPPKKATRSDAGNDYECMDNDGDGFGRYCELGADCDDNDPEVTDICRRCATVRENCPCTPGTEPRVCDPPDIQVEGGILVCSDGTRYCRDGMWSSCEVIGGYTFVKK